METYLNIALTSFITVAITSFFSWKVQDSYYNKKMKDDLLLKKITNLLMPLYIKFKQEPFNLSAEIINDKGNPINFITDLPKYYEDIIKLLETNLYLADKNFVIEALAFIEWLKIEKSDSQRLSKISEGSQSDRALESFKSLVFTEYEKNLNQLKKYGVKF